PCISRSSRSAYSFASTASACFQVGKPHRTSMRRGELFRELTMKIARKYIDIAYAEGASIAEGLAWYPFRSKEAIMKLGWLSSDFPPPDNLFDVQPGKYPLTRDQLLVALAMVIAVAEKPSVR